MFLVDVSPSMATTRTLDLAPGPNGEPRTKQVTYLQWSLQFAMLKIQEMVCPKSLCHSHPIEHPVDLQRSKDRSVWCHSLRDRGYVLQVKRIQVFICNACKETNNIVNRKDGGYDHVTEFIRIAQPNADTLAKLATLEASNVAGDRL